jgi:hypothetical protein
MHELGHTIGLYHGGGDPSINNKPNYLSNMNYIFTNAIVPDSELDYSDCVLNTLNEKILHEPLGVNGTSDDCINQKNKKSVFYESCKFNPSRGEWYGILPKPILIGHPADWNLSGLIDSDTIRKNINCDGRPSQIFSETLTGYDDWETITFLPAQNNLNSDLLLNVANNSTISVSNNTNNLNTQNESSREDLILQTLRNEPHQDNITSIALGTIVGINEYVEDTINSSSFTIPSDPEGILLSSETVEIIQPADLGKEYYHQILGDPLSNTSSSDFNASFGLISNTNDDTVTNDILTGNIDAAIEKLDILLLASDSSYGGEVNNDFVNNTSDQQKLIEQITYLQNQLKRQSCTFDNC